MLIRFGVENFRSLRDRQELSLAASSLRDAVGAVVDLPGLPVRVLRAAGIYGPNASGKTNVLRALNFMGGAVVRSHRFWDPDDSIEREPFLLDGESADRPSRFDLDILVDGVRYHYGFTATDSAFAEEWLHAYPEGRRQVWFTRRLQANSVDMHFGKGLSGENKAIRNLTRPNSLFLSAAAQNNHEQLTPIYTWFRDKLEFVNSGTRMIDERSTAVLCKREGYRNVVLDLLRSADIGITDLQAEEEEFDDDVLKAMEAIQAALSLGPSAPRSEKPKHTAVRLQHSGAHGRGTLLPFDDESDGTRALFSLLGPTVRALMQGGLLCVDELDASLHPHLSAELVRLFNDAKRNPNNAQLLFNTHDIMLLESKALRRDQVWFAEKDTDGATAVYPLSDFKTRRDESLWRGYLQGRYGAVPFMRDLVVPARIGSGDGQE